MTKYINKAVVVAEIERWIELIANERNQEGASQIDKLSLGGRIAELQEIKAFIDTLEVKKMDLDREIRRYRMNNPIIGHREESLYDYMVNVAKHFFELGLRVSGLNTATDRGMAEEIIVNLKRVENDYRIDLTKEIGWLRNISACK